LASKIFSFKYVYPANSFKIFVIALKNWKALYKQRSRTA